MATLHNLDTRLAKLEQPRSTPTIVAVILCGQDEPEAPQEPGTTVIQITLDAPAERRKADAL
jgi:hypothetical protein